ncbi:MAG: exopolysaccharide biosynthesis polyprenyl glycosylphosphotransferase [Actinomycetota bacterium]|nr:exopolysaccharide biosynthesis polyprenyl glycosylphosphotransferase [Actinomycetota bacterium]
MSAEHRPTRYPALNDTEFTNGEPDALALTDPTVVGRPSPRWLTMLEVWHSAAAHPLVLLVDGLIVAAMFRRVATTRPIALVAGAAFAALSPLTGLAAHRTSVQTQGVRWYLRPLAVLCAVMVGISSFFQPLRLTAPVTAAALLSASVVLILLRGVAWRIIAAARRRDLGLRPALIIGTSERVSQLSNELAATKQVGLRFAAAYTPTLLDTQAVQDGHAQAFSLLDHDEIDHVLLVNDGIDESVFREFVSWADDRRGYTLVLPLADIVRPGSRYHIGRFPVVPLPIGLSRKGLIAKRALDIFVSAVLIILTAPLMLLISAAIVIKDHNSVLFRQERVGKHGEVFPLFKFRTMSGSPHEHGEADATWATTSVGEAADDDDITPDRQTGLGRVLRRWDLDELPQLFNVVRGDMSLVGPRPERVHYVERFAVAIDGYADRHRVRPGMTGWAQVNGLRGQTPLAMRTAFDNDYVNRWSFGFDMRILIKTLPSVVWPPVPDPSRILSLQAFLDRDRPVLRPAPDAKNRDRL